MKSASKKPFRAALAAFAPCAIALGMSLSSLSCATTSPVYYSSFSPAPSRDVVATVTVYSVTGSQFDSLRALVAEYGDCELRSIVLLGDRAEIVVALPSRSGVAELASRLMDAGFDSGRGVGAIDGNGANGAAGGIRLEPLAWNREYVFTREAAAASFPCEIIFSCDPGSVLEAGGFTLVADGSGRARFSGLSIDLGRAERGEIRIFDRTGNCLVARRDETGDWYASASGTRDGIAATIKVLVEALR